MKHWPKSFVALTTGKGRRVRLWALPIIAGMLLALGLASGVLADSNTTPTVYYACVNNSSGTIHMISATGTCANNEQEIVWNNVGPQGPAGQQGPQGPAGPTGSQGIARAPGTGWASWTTRPTGAGWSTGTPGTARPRWVLQWFFS